MAMYTPLGSVPRTVGPHKLSLHDDCGIEGTMQIILALALFTDDNL